MRHLLAIDDLSEGEVTTILDTAQGFRRAASGSGDAAGLSPLAGRTVCNLFYEPSTRTRVSFELAAKRLSAEVVDFPAGARSSVSKGESFKDTALTLDAMGLDVIVVRHSSAGAAHRLAGWVGARVINAGDGTHEHPTQALLDLMTMREHFKDLEGLKVAIVGDITHSRVARSCVKGLTKMGAEVILVGPPTLIPAPAATTTGWGVTVTSDLDEVLEEIDVCYLLRVQKERQSEQLFPSTGEFHANWGLTSARVQRMRPEAVVMHPGPMNRGVEVESEVADLPRSLILDQVANGVAVRMSVLYLMLDAEGGAAWRR